MKPVSLGFGVIIAALVGLVVMGVVTARGDIAALQQTSKENIFWSAAQVEREFNALQVAVARHALDENADGGEVRRRFDILWSRVDIFGRGDVGKRLAANPEVSDRMASLAALLRELDPAVQALGPGPDEALRIVDALAALEPAVRQSTVDVLHADEQRFSLIRKGLREGLLLTAAAVAMSLIVAFALTTVFFRQSRRQAALVRETRDASASRERFLALVSHELRTPLNGLLGALSLLRGELRGGHLAELANEAHISAVRLSDMLTDAVDLSIDEAEPTEAEVFSLAGLAAQQQEILAPELRRREAGFTLRLPEGATPHVEGDLRRIGHAITHLILSAMQRGGAREITLSLDLRDGLLVAEISSDSMSPQSAFGETLAHGLIQKLGGTLTRKDTARIASIPVETVELTVATHFESTSLSRLYTSLLAAQGVTVATDSRQARMLLTDLNGVSRRMRVLRRDRPDLTIIGCGPVADHELFDGVVANPGDLPRVISTTLKTARRKRREAA